MAWALDTRRYSTSGGTLINWVKNLPWWTQNFYRISYEIVFDWQMGRLEMFRHAAWAGVVITVILYCVAGSVKAVAFSYYMITFVKLCCSVGLWRVEPFINLETKAVATSESCTGRLTGFISPRYVHMCAYLTLDIGLRAYSGRMHHPAASAVISHAVECR